MDLVPLAIDGDEWAHIERAVVQRATLLNAILADLYGSAPPGPRRPHSARAASSPIPAFLRACHGIVPPSGVYLHNYAVDLARAPNGTWWVISDRTQAPSGAGYALENRLVSARTLPAMLDQCRVRPLQRLLRRDDQGAARRSRPIGRANPRVVVLSAGPNSETYFEHSFFARQWDFPLVGGADLTVRDSRVYLKTLAGLNPVDVILRRLDDDFCDPLELRGDSLLGVPGLVQAARAGNVFIANCLGSGLVETPALMAFLPGLCRHVLGEELQMPSVATWWCGQEAPRRDVLEHLEHAGDQAGVSALRPARGVPGHDVGRDAPRAGGAHRSAPDALRGAGAGGPVDRAGAHPSRARGAARRAARARGLGRHVVRGAARAA